MLAPRCLTAPLLLIAVLVLPTAAAEPAAADKLPVYVGTYTSGASQGIYLLELDLQSGRLSEPVLAGEAVNPSFVALHPQRDLLYAVGEVGSFDGRPSGAVHAFAIDRPSGRLTLINTQASGGGGACHLSVDGSGRYVLVANYGGGSVSVLPLGEDGALGPATAFIQHEGSGADPRRQSGPHAHSVNLAPDNRFAFVADLGLDKIMIYRFAADGGTLSPNDPPWIKLAPGAGPRHFSFHPGGRFAYVINEMHSTITALAYDAQRGALEPLQTISTLPGDFSGSNTTAEILVHPTGKFVYGSNRGHDSIAVFAVDPQSGRLEAVEHEPTQGKTPRNFGIDPSGRFLLAANQASDSIVAFRIDASTGALTPTGHQATVAAPVCVRMRAAN